MPKGLAAKVAALAVLALLVAVVPGAIRLTERDSAQRVETDDTTDDGLDEAESAGRALDAVPLVNGAVALDQAIGAGERAGLLDLTGGDEAAGDPIDPDDPDAADAAADETTETTTDGTETTAETTDGETTTETTAGAGDAIAGQTSAGAGSGDGGSSTSAPATTTSTTAAPTTAAPTTTTAPPPPPPTAPTGGAPGADQRVLYVDGSRGSGSNPGTEDRPFRRPVEALTIAQPGTTIYIRGGTYDTAVHSGFSMRRSGTASNWIRIAAYPGERVELVTGGAYNNGFSILGASYIELSGFVIRAKNDSTHGTGVYIDERAHDIRVIGNQISNFGGAGISVIDSSRIHIEGNDVRNNSFRSSYQGSAISLYKMAGPTNSGTTNVIRGNYIVRNRNEVPHHGDGRITDGNCIIMDRNNEVGYSGWTLIENNVCAENGGRGVHSYRSDYIEARNNTLYHNMSSSAITHGRGEMTVGSSRDVYFYNNLVIPRPGIASYIDNDNTNSRFINNYVSSGPPPVGGNQLLPSGVQIFSSTSTGGPVSQFRPLGSAGLAGTADGSKQAATDFTGSRRPGTGAVGAFEP
ncbi:MAG: right-handed parallel beta-helix repeat-containing protein [Actinomycetota bacterium]